MAMQRFRLLASMRRKLRGYHDDEDGSHTIEFVLWVPIFILILSLVVDVCFLFLAQSRMFDVASDTARRLAIGRLDSSGAVTHARDNASFRGVDADATIGNELDDAAGNCATTCVVTITLPSRDVAVTGVLNFLASDNLTARVEQLKEGN